MPKRRKISARKAVFLLFLVIIALAAITRWAQVTAFAVVNINSCQNLGESYTTYKLTANIDPPNHVQSGLDYCMNFVADHITLDCNGFHINGDDSVNTMGIRVANRKNITIINCEITNYYYGIYFFVTNSSTIQNTTISSSASRGLWLRDGSSNNTISNNTIQSSKYDNIYLSGSSSYNNFEEIIVSSSTLDNGINFISGSNFNIINRSAIRSNAQNGIRLSSSHNNTIVNTVINSNSQYGVEIISSNDSEILKNNITSNQVGIRLTGTSGGNLITRNNIWNNIGAQGIKGLNNTMRDIAVVAEHNWWGDSAGPFDYSSAGACPANTQTNGDNVTDDATFVVDYCPWMEYLFESEPPKWSDNLTSNQSGTPYAPNALWQFNITWTDNMVVNETIFEWNGTTNYTRSAGNVKNESDEYFVTLFDLPAGLYTYRWLANDSSDNWNFTYSLSFNISKSPNPVSLTFTNDTGFYPNQNISLTYGSKLNATATSTGGNVFLFRNETYIGDENKQNVTLAAGVYLYKVNATGNQNYTDNSSLIFYVTINKAPNQVKMYLTNLSGTYTNQDIFARNNETLNITAVSEAGTAWLWRNESNWTDYNGQNITPEAGVWQFKVNATGNENYTDNSSLAFTVTVEDVTAPIISNISSAPSTSTATITWTTDTPSNSTVWYNTSSEYLGNNQTDTALVTSHSITLTGLSSSTTYYYNITSCDEGGCNTTGVYNFTTSSAAAPTGGGPGGGGAAGPGAPSPCSVREGNMTLLPASAGETISCSLRNTFRLFNITFSKDTEKSKLILLEAEPAVSKPAAYTYKYFTLETINITNSDISSIKTEFIVPNSWLEQNGLVPSAINLYGWDGSTWHLLRTTVKLESTENTYFTSTASSFYQVYAIAGGAACPVCPSPTEWSECINGTQTRTEWTCSEQTGFECKAVEVTRRCACPECPPPTEWSECVNNQMTRTNYRCSEETGFECQAYEETRKCVAPMPTIPMEAIAIGAIVIALVAGVFGLKKVLKKKR